MLFDLGWSEILLIGTVALIFIGPKDLPKAMRVAGYWVRKARTLSREFQSSIDQMIREAELDEMRQDLKKATEFDFDKEFRNTIDPTGSLAESLKPPELPDFSRTHTEAPAAAPHEHPEEIIEVAPSPSIPADLVPGPVSEAVTAPAALAEPSPENAAPPHAAPAEIAEIGPAPLAAPATGEPDGVPAKP